MLGVSAWGARKRICRATLATPDWQVLRSIGTVCRLSFFCPWRQRKTRPFLILCWQRREDADKSMEKCRRIYLYGNSVILGTLGASLRRVSRYEVSTLSPPWPETVDLEALAPDVILFDVEADRPEAAFFLLEKRPTFLVIGVSPDSNLVKIWSGRQLHELSTQGLLDLIDKQPKYAPFESGTLEIQGGRMNCEEDKQEEDSK